MDLRSLLRRSMIQNRNRTAVVVADTRRTYAELDERASRLANGLARLGLKPGDHVGLLLENQVEYPEVDVALAYGGFVRVALNARLAPADHAYVLSDCSARAIVTDHRFDEQIGDIAESMEVPWLRVGRRDCEFGSATDYDSFLS